MSVLNAAQRQALPASDFALPGGHCPIPDEGHARAALARGAEFASPSQLTEIRHKVHAKFPEMDLQGLMAHKAMGR